MKKKKFRVPFWGKLCAAVICAVMIVSSAGESAAWVLASASSTQSEIAELEKKIADLNKQNEQKKNQINGLTGDISENKAAIQTLNELINGIKDEIDTCVQLIEAKGKNIEAKSDEIDAVTLTIADKEREIEDKTLEIAELQAENKKNLANFAKLARQLYISDPSDVIPLLNGSDNWYGFFVYSDIIKDISRQNTLFMERLQNSIKQQEMLIEELEGNIRKLEDDKLLLEAQKEEFENQKLELESQMYDLTVNAEHQQNYVNDLYAQNQKLQSQISSLQSQINNNAAQIKKDQEELDNLIWLAQQANQGQIEYDDNFLWPVGSAYRKITTNFGYDPWRGGQHSGIDITGNAPGAIGNTNIYAVQSGTVIVASAICTHNYGKYTSCGCNAGYGNYVVIDHGGGITTLYGHCASINVVKGQKVTKGDVIGKVGTTGWSTGYHLHFEVRKYNSPTDPLKYTNYQYIK